MLPHLVILLSLAAVLPSLAEMRDWKSLDGVRSIQGEFIKRDATSVTIRGSDSQERTIELSKLHEDERKWLEAHHSLDGPIADPDAFFDTLTFRDTRESTLAKLKASKLVEMTSDETFIGRSGLNGVFQTRQKIGNLKASLYFDWTGDGKLKELNLQTDSLPLTDYKTQLQPSWQAFTELLTTLYEKPVQKGPFPPANSLADGTFSPSHLWNLNGGGSALLGLARDGSRYQLVVRFADKKTQLMRIR
jgi:hypothetical protein